MARVSLTRRGRTALLAAGALCTAGAILFAAASLSTEDAAASTTAVDPPVATPLASARRVPVIFERAAVAGARFGANAALSEQLQAALAPHQGCATAAVDGEVVAAIGAESTFAPASTLKLVVALAAVETLGADHRFTTTAGVDASGNLVVTGGGDPMLATAPFVAQQQGRPEYRPVGYTELAAFADKIVAAGVQRTVPAVLVDDRRHDALRFLPDWKSNYVPDGEIGALGALAVDGGLADPVARIAATDPAITTGQRLTELLTARGVTVGGVQRGAASGAVREVATIQSAPLSDIVGMMVTSSDNFVAEMLVREIGHAASPGTPATTAAGLAEVKRTLASLHVPVAGLALLDGSGLAPDSRMRCDTLLAVVDASQAPKFAAVDDSMAVAARSGTLAGSFIGDPLAGQLRAKTGSLNGVVGLAGLVDSGAGARFAFLAAGNFTEDQGEDLQVAVGRVVGSYPVVRPPADLVPAP